MDDREERSCLSIATGVVCPEERVSKPAAHQGTVSVSKGPQSRRRLMSCTPACPICLRLREAALAVLGDGSAAGLSHGALEREAGLMQGEAAEHYASAAACLHATYEEVCDRLAGELLDAFSAGMSWESALSLARRRLLARLAANPGEARLCFVETLGGDRELRRRRERRRRWVVAFLACQRLVSGESGRSSELQIELLIGATFHEISAVVAAGDVADLPTLEPRLSELPGLFDPSAYRRSFAPRAQPAWSAR